MENASKALIIAGAILLSILIIAIGMLIYTNAQSTITESMTSFGTQETEAFNSNFESYMGAQTGSKINTMCTRLIANANTYADEVTKLPAVYIDKISSGNNANFNITPGAAGSNNGQQNYIDQLTLAKNQLESKHTYHVTISYQSNGLIDYIMVWYDTAGNNQLHVNNRGK
jgi:hypothetical protein